MKRVGKLWQIIISDENLNDAITEVNRTHHWHSHHRPNLCTAWVEETREERLKELRTILINGFIPTPPKIVHRYDPSAQKWRTISEPAQWPDQYVHHALIQVLQPIMMRGMDRYCCGSIRGRGAHYGKIAIEYWLKTDIENTQYCLQCDIRHFYESLQPQIVIDRMRHLIKDHKTLDLIERIIKDGILIGAYTSQWFANTVLQPLDNLIHDGNFEVSHYIRYMDNITVFSHSKEKLAFLRIVIEEWLNERSMELKGDWQIFPTQNHPNGGRMPTALGYRYGAGYTIPKKRNLFRLKRQIKRYRKRRNNNKRISVSMAAGMISRFGQLKHCNNKNLYKNLLNGEKLQKELKIIIRRNQKRKENISWNSFMEQREILKC